MMGSQRVEQGELFYEFSLERHVPGDHLLRSIDRFVDLSEMRRDLAPFYSSIGRPSVDPELMIRMLIVGYCFGIRSERRLCEEVHLNLAYRWFCRLGLDGDVPDHSTFSKNRHGRFRDSDLLRKVFETVVRRCMAEGSGRRGWVRGRRQPDQGRRQQAALRRGLGRCRLGGDGARRADPSESISTRSMRRHGARPARPGRSSSPGRTRLRNGPAPSRGMRSSPTPPTT